MKAVDVEKIKKYLKKEGVDVNEKDSNYIYDIFRTDDVAFIIFEQYNFPNLHCRWHTKDSWQKDYLAVLEDYFDDCDHCEDSLIYDVANHKFVIVSKEVTVKIIETIVEVD